MNDRLGREFFEEYTPNVARKLIGNMLVRIIGEVKLVGMIVEVEAYRGTDDPASHAYRGLTKRNRVMFGEPGHAYIYFVYGNNWCLNVTTEPEGIAAAVLIRAVQPIKGIDFMMKKRRVNEISELTNGPGKLTEAFCIDGKLNGEDMILSDRLYFVKGRERIGEIVSSPRIGVKVGLDKEWRFYLKDNPFVSKIRSASVNP